MFGGRKSRLRLKHGIGALRMTSGLSPHGSSNTASITRSHPFQRHIIRSWSNRRARKTCAFPSSVTLPRLMPASRITLSMRAPTLLRPLAPRRSAPPLFRHWQPHRQCPHPSYPRPERPVLRTLASGASGRFAPFSNASLLINSDPDHRAGGRVHQNTCEPARALSSVRCQTATNAPSLDCRQKLPWPAG